MAKGNTKNQEGGSGNSDNVKKGDGDNLNWDRHPNNKADWSQNISEGYKPTEDNTNPTQPPQDSGTGAAQDNTDTGK